MQALLQQLPTLVGVLLGAAATYVATSTAERSRWRRQQSVRWDIHRFEAYAEYAHALKRVITIAVQIAASRGIHPNVDWHPSSAGLEALTAADEERTSKWEKVLLLGSDEVVLAARRWHNSVYCLQRVAGGFRTDTSWAEAVEMVSQGRQEFYQTVKYDLGTAANFTAEAYQWQLSRLLRETAADHG